MSWQHITVERVIPAPPEAIFDLLADPTGQQRIDGSGTVRRARSGDRRLALGDAFGMDMRLGVTYATRNVVTEFEENRRIAWRTMATGPVGWFATGRTWRYELEPVADGTRVRETWDLSTERITSRPTVRVLMGSSTRGNMSRTLQRIELVLGEAQDTSSR